MKFFEQMEPKERGIMIRKAVAFSVSLEGMDETVEAILDDSIRLESNTMLATTESTTDRINE